MSDRDLEGMGSMTDVETPKRAYAKPEIVELGDVRELTRGSGGSRVDLNGTRRV